MRVIQLASLCLTCTGVVWCQGPAGRIEGRVVDPIGEAVVNVTVQAKNTADGKLFRANTAAGGAYTLKDLPAGTYEVMATISGYSGFDQKNVAVSGAKTTPLDVHLQDTTQLGTLGEDRLAIEAAAGRHHPPAGPTPRLKDGKPDLSGTWWSPRTIDPGHPEWLPNAVAVAKERTDNNRRDSPQARCLPAPVLRLGPVYAIVASTGMMVIISDDDSPGFHQVYLDGRAHPGDPVPAWYGHNVGHWEGDTLVVDRVGFNDQVWLDQESHPHSDKLHVIEKYTRPDLGHLLTEITVEDPGVLTRPYTMKRESELAPQETIYEFICPENNRDMGHMVGK
jgi:hypothetical protein